MILATVTTSMGVAAVSADAPKSYFVIKFFDEITPQRKEELIKLIIENSANDRPSVIRWAPSFNPKEENKPEEENKIKKILKDGLCYWIASICVDAVKPLIKNYKAK